MHGAKSSAKKFLAMHMVKKLPAFIEPTRRLIIVFTKVRHWVLPRVTTAGH